MPDLKVTKEQWTVFLEELGEQIQEAELLILKIEKSQDPQTLNDLFRVVHTVKGSAALVGQSEMAELAHGMESVLDAVREKHLEISPEIIEVLLSCLDALKKQREDLSLGKQVLPQTANLLAALQSILKIGPERIFEVIVNFSPDCEMPSVRAYQVLAKLKGIGNIVFSNPGARELKEEAPIFSAFIVQVESEKSVNEIEMLLQDVGEVSSVSVKTLEKKAASLEASQLGGKGSPTDAKSIHTVRVNVELFDNLMNLVGELVTGRTRLMKIGSVLGQTQEAGGIGQEVVNSMQDLSKIIGALQDEVMKARLVAVEAIMSKFPRMIRDLSLRSQKEIIFEMEGENTQMDRSILEEISDPMIHLLRNAVDHGIEDPDSRLKLGKPRQGNIKLQAFHQENHVILRVSDDGRGIDLEMVKRRALERGILTPEKSRTITPEEVLNLIFTPGFSTAQAVSDVSGRGVGLDIVKQRIKKIGGKIEVDSTTGKGTSFKIKLPFSLAIVEGLQVLFHETAFVIPTSAVREISQVEAEQLKTLAGKKVLMLRGNVIPLVWLGESFGESFPEDRKSYSIAVLSLENREVAVAVDAFLGNQEFVIKTIGPLLGDLPGVSGATVLADGSVGLILDVGSFIQLMEQKRGVPAAA